MARSWLTSALALLAALIAAGVAVALPAVDYTVPAGRDTEPVILTGAQFGDWSTTPDFSFKLPLTDLQDCQSFDDKCEHNHYADPEVQAPPQQGTPTDRLLGYRWNDKAQAWQQIPFQVDEMFTRYLNNSASGFSVYSGEDQHTTYAFDREGFRYRVEDPSDPCHALPDHAPAADPVRGLDANDEVVFMSSDAGPAAPATAALPPGIESAKQVAIADPTNPSAPPRYAYVMKAKADGPKPAFNAENGYVRYQRDADADTFLFSQSNYDGYGNAPRGHFYEPGMGCVGADASQFGTGPCNEDLKWPRNAGDPNDPFYHCPQRHRPGDRAWITTPRYQFRYDGRWLLTKLQVSTDGGSTYGPDMIDRWKARAFAQDPESKTPCCGFEEEDTNWGGSSTLLGERSGPVRAIRETWGADSGTNVIRRETFYRDEIRQKSYLRVHVIPPLDGIYAQWDFNAGRVTKYFNPLKSDGVAIDGRNDETFGNMDDPCTPHYDQNDTGPFTQGYREAYRNLQLCDITKQPPDDPDCPPYCHLSMDITDPSFSGTVNSSLMWNQVTGPAGGLVDRYSIEKATDLTPGGAAQSLAAVPYYRDDSCFDDGTGSDPGPKLRPRNGMMSEPTASDGTPRRCWNYRSGDPEVPDGDDHFFQGDIATHGVHLLFIADSDNARQTVPLDEIVSEQRMVVLPPCTGNVGEQYGRGFEKPQQAVVADYSAGAVPTGTTDPGGTPPGASGAPAGGCNSAPAAPGSSATQESYPGGAATPADAPSGTKPEASEGGVAAYHRGSASPCLPARQRFRSRGIGRFRLGDDASRALRRSGRPAHGRRGALVWCVRGGGRVLVAFTRRGDARLIASTAPKTSARGVTPGDRLAEVKRKFRGARRVGGNLWEAGSGSTRTVIGLRAGRVHFAAVVDRRLLESRRLMKSYLSAIDL